MMDIKEVWRAGLVTRWHSNPDMAWTGQSNGEHSYGVAVLALGLFPNDHELLRAAILHDAPESGVGDLGGKAKRDNPDLKRAYDAVEEKRRVELGIGWESSGRLKLCDRLEAYIYVAHRNPRLLATDDWPMIRKQIEEDARWYRVWDKVKAMLPEVMA
jgi:5'-deoxynucleotidase YfbR-like HD superfamily hydrolase